MITNRRTNIATDPRGKIKTGIKAISSGGKEYPKGTDYFVITPFPELIAVYGEKPAKLLVMPPADDLEAVFDDSYVLYGGRTDANKQGTKIRTCDGTRCFHRIAETVPYHNEDGKPASVSFNQGEETDCICEELGLFTTTDKEIRKKACRYTMYARFFVGNPITGRVISPMPILFESGSRNTGAAIHDALENMAAITANMTGGRPRLQYQRFELEVHMVEGKNDPKQKFPIWRMSPIGIMADIAKQLTAIARLMGRDEEVKRLLEANEKANVPTGQGLLSAPAQAKPVGGPVTEEEEALFDESKVDPDNPLGVK